MTDEELNKISELSASKVYDKIMLEVNAKINGLEKDYIAGDTELRLSINELTYITKTSAENIDKLLEFQKNESNKPNKLIDNIKGMLIGALITIGASFLSDFLKK